MSLKYKQLELIEEADLVELIESKTSEARVLDYKMVFAGDSEAERKEFLADVSSFANASGGDIVYGMREEAGVPVELRGLEVPDPDALRLSLENRILDGIAPRIIGLGARVVPLSSGKSAVVIRVPRSWALPHMVTYRGYRRFYGRTSAGKYPLDVGELRALFAASETTAERVRNLRVARIMQIIAAEAPVPLDPGPKVILHVVPLRAFDPGTSCDVTTFEGKLDRLALAYWGSKRSRYNFDGLVTYGVPPGGGASALGYVQLFRNGIIETVDTVLVGVREDEDKVIMGRSLEDQVLKMLEKHLAAQQQLGCDPPTVAMLSLLGVNAYRFLTEGPARLAWIREIDRPDLLVREVVIESPGADLSAVMKPCFDAVWNAAGWPGSPHYDAQGKRQTAG